MSLNPRTPGANHNHSTSRLSTVPTSASKTRQLSHLHAQLAQLTANMSDMENLLRMTAVQAEGMRGLGGYAGGMFMAASKVLGEETVNGATGAAADASQSSSTLTGSRGKPLLPPRTLTGLHTTDPPTSDNLLPSGTASSHTFDPNMDTSPPPSEDYLAVITQLMSEKDRLVTEKDELVVSKDRLWREMHQIIQEKNERVEELFARCTTVNSRPLDDSEIQVLRNEVRRLRHRNLELERALRDTLETEDDNGENSMNASGSSAMISKNFGDMTNTEHIEHNSDGIAHPYAPSGADLDRLLQLHTPTSPNVSLDDTECITVTSRPSTLIRIRPVIQSDSYITHTYGQLESLEPALLEMVLKLFESVGPHDKFVLTSHQGSQNCIDRRLNAAGASAWTNEQPGCFACRTCFNKRQPCIRVIGNHEFLLLPLPMEARHTLNTWQDGSYYMYQYDGTTMKFPGVWNKSKG